MHNKRKLKIAFFGSSLVSAYWNGAATYYRGIIRALHGRGHQVTFYEPDAYQRQENRDMADPDWAKVVVYPATEEAVFKVLEEATEADIVVKASGVGVFDELLEAEVLKLQTKERMVVFWDVDAPATLDRVHHNPQDPFLQHIPQYDMVLTYGGGEPVIQAYEALGAKKCVPIYNALDTSTHFPVAANPDFACDLAFLGNRLPDREARVEHFFLDVAVQLPDQQFIIGGSGWGDKPMSSNVKYIGHVYTKDHNAFNCTPKAVLNISRESMARYGFSPATRVFEAAGAASCIITDYWEGIDFFFEPDTEILVAKSGAEVAQIVASLTDEKAKAIGQAAYKKVLSAHTYNHRADQLETLLYNKITNKTEELV
ncbi:CgeB family protein [Adhaeribacter aquaticus]|uniref:CgeB family protein n=1 Tax=Adhaeribacter aquaticus TaxID=299567 RepID=UPI000423374E|nr:glycosyltransferase [Adhaeribacter aquaticus]